MPRLTDQEKADILRHLEQDKPLDDKFRFLLFDDKREIIRVAVDLDPVAQKQLPGMEKPQMALQAWEERWTGEYIFENEWQSFRTKKDRALELTSAAKEVEPGKGGRRKIAVKVVDIFGNDTMTIVDVMVGEATKKGRK